jgi:excinuclease ABC subunit B
VDEQWHDLNLEEIPQLITTLEKQMHDAAKKMEFEHAAKLRDRIKSLRDKILGR